MPRVLCSLSLAGFTHNFNSYFQWLLTPGQACKISRKAKLFIQDYPHSRVSLE